MFTKLEEFKKLLNGNEDKSKEIYSRVISNLDHTQKKIIQYRKLLAVYLVFYYLAVFDHLNLIFINQYLKISKDNPFLSIGSIEKLIIIVAPMFFSILYYIMVLSKFHRGLLNVFINKYNNSELISFVLTHPYSAGLVRGFLNKMKGKERLHVFNKYLELYFYLITIGLSVVLMVFFLIKDFSPATTIFVVISATVSLIVLLKLRNDIDDYWSFKIEFMEYKFLSK